ncbi:MAG: amidohydrolase family protein [candidate division NC10 bacterium]
MKELTFVDADAHVEECEEIWNFMDPEYQPRRPVAVTLEAAPGRGNLNAFWLIDGKALPQPVGSGASFLGTPTSCTLSSRQKSFSRGSQELTDIAARLRDMDKMGIDIQVIFPTLFNGHLTDDPELEAALAKSYNSWMAEACGRASDRLKWNAVMPLRAPEAAAKEARRAKGLGAVGVMVYGTAGEKLLNHPSLDPFYAALLETRLPLCVHVGWSFPPLNRACDNPYAALTVSFALPYLMGFFAIVDGVLDRFPGLRVGFFEGGSEWVPFWVDRMDQYYGIVTKLGWGPLPKKAPSRYLQDGNLYITCEAEDRLLPQTLAMWGEDRVMLSSDMPHAEQRDNAKDELGRRGDLAESTKRKILVDNALRFYSLG